MTLSTKIYIHQPIDIRPLFDWINRELLHVPEGNIEEDEELRETSSVADWYVPGHRRLSNLLGQGYNALLWIDYRRDAELLHDGKCDEDCAEIECENGRQHPSHYVWVRFDTGYSYQDEHGGVANLHARYVAQVGRWLDERGIAWSWCNEFTGEVHQGTEGLVGLCTQGAEAQKWFRELVLPTITGGQR